jgi:hypothetical protein
MAHAELAGFDQLPDALGKIEQSQQVGDVAAALVDELAERLLGVAIFADQPLIALRFLDRVEVAALDILEQGDFERLGVVKSRTMTGIS